MSKSCLLFVRPGTCWTATCGSRATGPDTSSPPYSPPAPETRSSRRPRPACWKPCISTSPPAPCLLTSVQERLGLQQPVHQVLGGRVPTVTGLCSGSGAGGGGGSESRWAGEKAGEDRRGRAGSGYHSGRDQVCKAKN